MGIVSNFASKTKAKIPAASGAAAEVPVCWVVHLPCKSALAYKKKYIRLFIIIKELGYNMYL